MKKFAKLFMIVACLAMMLCVSVGVSADEPAVGTVVVDIHLQSVDRWYDSDGDGAIDTKYTTPNVKKKTCNTDARTDNNAIRVTVASTATLMDALNTAGLAVAPSYDEDTEEWSDNFYWKRVDILDANYQPTGNKAWALQALCYNNTNYANVYSYPAANVYEGTSWMYFPGNPLAMPPNGTNYDTENYPTDYLDMVLVTSLPTVTKDDVTSYEFTMSYEFDHMEW